MSEISNEYVLRMLEKDAFSAWLGIQVLNIKPGACTLQMKVKPQMLNGFETLHGGISFALADSALAFASNAYGRLSVAIDAHISYPVASRLGDVLTAKATEVHIGDKLGIYQVVIQNQKQETIALFKGTVYRTTKNVVET